MNDRRQGRDPLLPERPAALSSDLRSVHGKLQDLVEMLRSDRARRLGVGAAPVSPAQASRSPGEPRPDEDRLQERLADLERAHRELCEASAREEERISDLRRLVVALERLHGTIDHAEVLTALREIVVNLVGCEELAVFLAEEGGAELTAALAFGVEGPRLSAVRPGSGPAGWAVAERRCWFTGEGAALPGSAGVTACVPLHAGGEVIGVLVLWNLLEHKPALTDRDTHLLEQIGAHAGTALHLTRLARQLRGAPLGPTVRP